jgi:DNA helicase-2/ATP-dependent DNA helicase PcrA
MSSAEHDSPYNPYTPPITDFDLSKALLNPEQMQAVLHRDGPMLVLAGAGSGKTRVITFRIAHMVASGVEPEQIVAMSFTNKAATEMRHRLAAILGKELAKRCRLSTFHALGAEILRNDIDALGFRPPLTIMDEADQRALMRELIDELKIGINQEQLDEVLQLVSRAKMAFCAPNMLPGMKFNPWRGRIQKVFERYNRALKSLNSVDFDDLISLPVRLLREHPDVRERLQSRWRFFMVDEYQDTNASQFELLCLLAGAARNVAVVGDDDQSIYGFRGADSSHILSFDEQFKGARVVTLAQNYRSTGLILGAANAVIANNTVRRHKVLWSDNKQQGAPIQVVACRDDREEAAFVAADIQRRRSQDGLKLSDFAVLYRSHPQSKLIEEAFKIKRITCRIVGGTRFFDRMEVRDVLNYLRACVNPTDDLALRRILNTPPRGLGPSALNHLDDVARAEGLSFWHTLQRAVRGAAGEELSQRAHGNLVRLLEVLGRYQRSLADTEVKTPAHEQARGLLREVYYIEHLRNASAEGKQVQRRVENVLELLDSIARFEVEQPEGSLAAFLERVALEPPEPAASLHEDAVTMMTLHASKGLEFPVVYMVGCEDGLLPHERSRAERGGLEEERRLCYVGITRAREHLVMTRAAQRTQFGKLTPTLPSPFLAEIPAELVENLGDGESSAAEQLTELQKERDRSYLDALRSAIFGAKP